MGVSALKLKREKIKANRTIIYLLSGILLCFGATALLGYLIGDTALEGVSQPEENPIQELDGAASGNGEVMAKFVAINVDKVAKDTRIYIQKQKSLPKTPSGDGDKKATQTEKKP